MTVHIDIGEIVLHGVAVADVGAFRAAIAAELTDLAAAGGTGLADLAAASGGGGLADREVGSLRAPGVDAGSESTLARDVAGSVWHAVSPRGAAR